MIKALDLSASLGGQSNADELQYLISVIESVNWKTVPEANYRRPEAWRRLSYHSPGRLEAAGDFVKYDSQSSRVFVTEVCSDWQARSSFHPSSSRPESVVSARSLDEVLEVPVTGTVSNTLVRIWARSSWVVNE